MIAYIFASFMYFPRLSLNSLQFGALTSINIQMSLNYFRQKVTGKQLVDHQKMNQRKVLVNY